MWIPKNAAEVEAAANAGDREETASFDGKRELPRHPRQNAGLAVDVAAMATDGGVLLYGLGEDDDQRLTVLAPFTLAGAADKVDQIVSTSLAEVPYIEVKDYPTTENPAVGYLAVIVPQSAGAPHQVIVGGEFRFYGRGAKGNRVLTEDDVARLYERRQSWAVDRDQVLSDVIDHAPLRRRADAGYLHAFTRPVVPDCGMYERACPRSRNPPHI